MKIEEKQSRPAMSERPRGVKLLRAVGALGLAFALGCQPSSEEVRRDSAVGSIGSAADSPKLDPDTVGRGADSAARVEGTQR